MLAKISSSSLSLSLSSGGWHAGHQSEMGNINKIKPVHTGHFNSIEYATIHSSISIWCRQWHTLHGFSLLLLYILFRIQNQLKFIWSSGTVSLRFTLFPVFLMQYYYYYYNCYYYCYYSWQIWRIQIYIL